MTLSQEAIAWLADKGYDERMGARPLARVIQEHIKKPLADELLFGKLKNGGTVQVAVEDGKLSNLSCIRRRSQSDSRKKSRKPRPSGAKCRRQRWQQRQPPRKPEPKVPEPVEPAGRKPRASVPMLPKKK